MFERQKKAERKRRGKKGAESKHLFAVSVSPRLARSRARLWHGARARYTIQVSNVCGRNLVT